MKLVKRNRIWWVDYTANGHRHRQSTHTANRKLAEAWLANLNIARKMPTFEDAVEVLRRLYQQPTEGVLPVSGIVETYERIAKATGKVASDDTQRKRRCHVERLIEWLQKERPTIRTVEMVSGPIAAAYAERLATLGLKTKTRRNIIGDLSTVWNLLEKAAENVRNPWTNLSPPDTDGERGKAFSPEQEQRVLAAAKKVGKDWFPICVIMRQTGLRYNDVAHLTWGEIVDGVIRMDPHKTRRHGISVAIPLTAEAQAAISSLAKRGDYLFPVHAELYGHRAEKTRDGLVFREVLDEAGITGTGYSIHSWRHTAATRLAAAGADIETRKRILGHTVDETARRYDHDEHLAEMRAALERSANQTAPAATNLSAAAMTAALATSLR